MTTRPVLKELLANRAAQPLPSPSDWTFDLIAEYHAEIARTADAYGLETYACLLYTSPSPRDKRQSRMPSSA